MTPARACRAVVRSILPAHERIPTVIVGTFTAIYVLGSFTVPYLTGPTAPNLLGPSMSNFFTAFNQPQQAEVLAIVVFVLALGIGAVYVWANVRTGKRSGLAHERCDRRAASVVASSWFVFVMSLLVFMVGPIVWLGLRAFSGLWRYPQLLPDPVDAERVASGVRRSEPQPFDEAELRVRAGRDGRVRDDLPAGRVRVLALQVPGSAVPAHLAVRRERVPENRAVHLDGRRLLLAQPDRDVPRCRDRAADRDDRLHDLDPRSRVLVHPAQPRGGRARCRRRAAARLLPHHVPAGGPRRSSWR